MARLKGMRRWRVIAVHALSNALAPIINVVALNLAYLIVGVVLVEVAFVYPGLGQLLVDSVARRDDPRHRRQSARPRCFVARRASLRAAAPA